MSTKNPVHTLIIRPDKEGYLMTKSRNETDHFPPEHPVSEKQKQMILEQLWLTYYNDTLYANGVITEEERSRMRVRIRNRASITH